MVLDTEAHFKLIKANLGIDFEDEEEDAKLKSNINSEVAYLLTKGIPLVPKGHFYFDKYCDYVMRAIAPNMLEAYNQSNFYVTKLNSDLSSMQTYFELNPKIIQPLENHE